jgi:hypothetical protein
MPVYKATYFFSCGAQGFSESWYLVQNTLQLASATANGTFLKNRSAILGNSTYIQAVRVVDVLAPGSNLLNILPAAPVGAPGLNRDNASNAIQVRAFTTTDYRRIMWLRAVPDAWITINTNGQAIPNQLAQTGVTILLNNAGVNGYGLRALSTDPGVNAPQTIYQMIVPAAAPFNIQFSTLANNGYGVGQYVRISQLKGDYLRSGPPQNWNLNGIFQVTAVINNTTFAINALATDWGYNLAPVYFSGGIVRSRWRVDNAPGGPFPLPPIQDGHVIRYSRRKPGRAFFVPAGRQRAQRRW